MNWSRTRGAGTLDAVHVKLHAAVRRRSEAGTNRRPGFISQQARSPIVVPGRAPIPGTPRLSEPSPPSSSQGFLRPLSPNKAWKVLESGSWNDVGAEKKQIFTRRFLISAAIPPRS